MPYEGNRKGLSLSVCLIDNPVPAGLLIPFFLLLFIFFNVHFVLILSHLSIYASLLKNYCVVFIDKIEKSIQDPKIMSISACTTLKPFPYHTFFFASIFHAKFWKGRKCKTQIYMTYLNCHEVESTGALKETYKAAIQFKNSQSS